MYMYFQKDVEFISLSSLIIDDFAHGDGVTRMGVLGGAGPHCVFGMNV